MRPLTILFLLVVPLTARATDLRTFDDAPLRSVQFIDDKEGWAVGDEGVVWHTIDCGKTWERQATAVRASLRSVHFPLPYQGVGWIAGREELPQGGSVGVLLFTRDGGVNWKKLLVNALPGLNQVRFVTPQTGFLIGDSSDQFSTGVFKTVDAGRTWEPVKGPRTSSWHAGEFQDADNAILAGSWSRLATWRNGVFSTAQVDPLDGRSILGLQATPQRLLAVGQGGLLLSSVSGGARWGFVDTRLPRDVLSNLDFHAVHAVGTKVWIAGRPGSFLLHSPDQGETWAVLKTGQPLPLHGLHFHDDQRGWVVGEGGMILATVDGGRSWTVQRQGGKRAAALFVHAQPEQVAADMLARLGGHEGYFATVLRVVAPDPVSSAWHLASSGQRFSSASRLAGGWTGETLWHFPLPQHLAGAPREPILQHWNALHGGDAERHVLRQLVLALRQWRPSVVVTDDPAPPPSAASALVAEALRVAVRDAADPKVFPEQVDVLGLQPWRVVKYYAAVADKKDAHLTFDSNQISARLEGSFRDFAASAATIFSDAKATAPGHRSYRLLDATAAGKQTHFMEGLAIEVGDARRLVFDDKDDPVRLKMLQEGRNLTLLADTMKDGGTTLGQLVSTLAKLPEEQGARIAYAIANSYARRGQWHLAREAFLVMVDRYPGQPLTLEAYRWLIRHASSSEARRRHEMGQFLVQAGYSFEPKGQPFDPKGGVQQANMIDKVAHSNTTFLKDEKEARHAYLGSLDIGKKLAGYGPLFASDPATQFCLQSSRRRLGQVGVAREWFEQFVNHFPRGPWHDAAVSELWLMGGGGSPAKRTAMCRLTDRKPFLDGKFDDPCWQGLKPLLLDQAVGAVGKDYATEAWFAYDDQFLYIALRCRHPAAAHVPAVKDRPRDADLTTYDRVSILLDLDRDYGTYFHLQIDQRGCVREDCWGDATWDPRWFVAVNSTPEAWCIEATMPLGQLTGEPTPINTAWACNVTRILPGRGVQAWSMPADVQPRPEGMGLLIFQTDRK